MKLADYLPDDVFHRFWDTFSIGTLLATLVGWLPHVASIVTIVWGLIRIYETKTVQNYLKRRHHE